jgi:hypothetical protein
MALLSKWCRPSRSSIQGTQPTECPRHRLASSLVLVLASSEGVAGITAVATIIAALLIAGITAKTTGSHQERQLTAEAERQERELDARTSGQRRQLTHARELADLADLRRLLDEFAVTLNRSRAARDKMLLLAQTARHIRSALEQQVDEVADAAKEPGQDLLALTVRLQVRLGSGDPITVAACETADALHAMWQQVELLPHQEDFSASHTIISSANSDFTRSAMMFIDAAVERAGTVAFMGT